MGLSFDFIDGQTPLDEDEIEGLRIPSISTRRELDEFEQQNIEQAIVWTLSKRFTLQQIMQEAFIKELHKRMYRNVWSWAGVYRKTDKNIGISYWKIPVALNQLIADTLFWAENNTFVPDEIAIRFKHRLVSIHCFSNGNGRHSRLMADLIIEKIFHQPLFSWGRHSLVPEKQARENYIKAVKAADKEAYSLLFAFARS
ncbi:MAG: hypothetical protein RLZZ543_714 [Bacteroidota bacterium]|jgi:Fic-DOC domain mobile mystery protein B